MSGTQWHTQLDGHKTLWACLWQVLLVVSCTCKMYFTTHVIRSKIEASCEILIPWEFVGGMIATHVLKSRGP